MSKEHKDTVKPLLEQIIARRKNERDSIKQSISSALSSNQITGANANILNALADQITKFDEIDLMIEAIWADSTNARNQFNKIR